MPDIPNAPVPLPALLDAGASLPEYASAGAAGADLRASEAVEIVPGGRAAVPTGVRLQIPPGHVGLVWPRSGLAVRHGIDTLAGVIDSDYRGEVRVVLVNHGDTTFRIAPGDRVAQLLVQRVERAVFMAATGIDDTERGCGRLRLHRPLRAATSRGRATSGKPPYPKNRYETAIAPRTPASSAARPQASAWRVFLMPTEPK